MAELKTSRDKHLSDLRVLLDKSAERELKLQGMLEIVIQERHYRPTVSAPAADRPESPLSPEHMQDVTVFDEDADAAQIQSEEDAGRELNRLIDEQRTRGLTKPEEVLA